MVMVCGCPSVSVPDEMHGLTASRAGRPADDELGARAVELRFDLLHAESVRDGLDRRRCFARRCGRASAVQTA
jgi:hypothetical protein